MVGSIELFGYASYLTDGGIVTAAIATILSIRCNGLLESVIDNIFMPVIEHDSDNDGIEDIKSIEKKELNIFGAKIKYGKVIADVIKFLIITYILFTVAKLLKVKK
jgi:large-conductance mechanosensitive channel